MKPTWITRMQKLRHISFLIAFLSLFLSAHNVSASEKSAAHDDFILTPIPKAGTHLIMRCIGQMTGKGVVGLMGGTKEAFVKSLNHAKQKNAILICHHYSGNFASTLYKMDYKNIFMCRDPRDACVSLVVYLDTMEGKQRDFFAVPDEWDDLSFDEKLYAVIVGKNCKSYVRSWYERLSPWSKYPKTLIVRFEDLVGANGGGDDTVQQQTLVDIAAFTNMDIGFERIQEVAKNLYKTTAPPRVYNGMTYYPGQIGNWKIFFNKKNKQAFKRSFNHLLVEFGYEQNMNW